MVSAVCEVLDQMQCSWLSKVFDVMIHRLLEQPPVQRMLDAILEHIGCLYKFHGESSVVATGQVANSRQVLLSSLFNGPLKASVKCLRFQVWLC